MLNYILKSISYPKKSQVTVYIFTVMATLVLTAFIVIEVGKTAKDKTHSDNAADAGALAGGSVMATGFNYFSDDNNSQHDTQQDYERKKYKEEQNRHDEIILGNDTDIYTHMDSSGSSSGSSSSGNSSGNGNANYLGLSQPQGPATDGEAAKLDDKAAEEAEKNLRNSSKAQEAENLYQKWADDRQQKRRDTLDGSNTNDYVDTALSQAYKILFQNAGVSHRLGRAGQKMYSAFLQSLEPGSVQSGMPKTFFWVDGSGRAHMVTGIVCIEPATNHDLKVTPNTLTAQKNLTKTAVTEYQSVANHSKAAAKHHTSAQAYWDLGDVTQAEYEDMMGDNEINQALAALETAKTARTNWMIGEGGRGTAGASENGRSKASSSGGDDNDDILEYVNDIQHSRTVQAMTFQFHMGSPIKSVYGDMDTMTFYPPVQSSAVANFNYTGQGNIHRSGNAEGSDPKQECGLVAAF